MKLKLITIMSLVSLLCSSQTNNRLTKNQNQMFTIEQIKEAHSKVKSGAQYPVYVHEIIKLGVTSYTTYVTDGNTFYEGKESYKIESGAKYQSLKIADRSNKEAFIIDIKAHQQGKSDYSTFCRQCSEYGIEKWVADLTKMTCTYYDKAGDEMLVEEIPH